MCLKTKLTVIWDDSHCQGVHPKKRALNYEVLEDNTYYNMNCGRIYAP